MMLSLKKHSLLYQAISSLPFTRSKRWSNTMARRNLISTCLEYKPANCRFLTKVLCIDALLEKHRYKYSKKVPSKLKKVIFDQLSNKSRSVSNIKECKKFCDDRGYEVLEGAISSVGISDGDRETIKESVDKLKSCYPMVSYKSGSETHAPRLMNFSKKENQNWVEGMLAKCYIPKNLMLAQCYSKSILKFLHQK